MSDNSEQTQSSSNVSSSEQLVELMQRVDNADGSVGLQLVHDDSDEALIFQSQAIELNGERHVIVSQAQDPETGEILLVLQGENGDHIAIQPEALSSMVQASADGGIQVAVVSQSDESNVALCSDTQLISSSSLSDMNQTAVSVTPAISALSVAPLITNIPTHVHTTATASTNVVQSIDTPRVTAQQDTLTLTEKPIITPLLPINESEEQKKQTIEDNSIKTELTFLDNITDIPAVKDINLKNEKKEKKEQIKIEENNSKTTKSLDTEIETVAKSEALEVSSINITANLDTNQSESVRDNDSNQSTAEIGFGNTAVIQVQDSGDGTSPLETLMANAMLSGDGNYVIMAATEDGQVTGLSSELNLSDVINAGTAAGQAFYIETSEGLVACTASASGEDGAIQIIPTSTEINSSQASGNLMEGQIIQAISGQTMALTFTTSSGCIELTPIHTSTQAPISATKTSTRGRGGRTPKPKTINPVSSIGQTILLSTESSSIAKPPATAVSTPRGRRGGVSGRGGRLVASNSTSLASSASNASIVSQQPLTSTTKIVPQPEILKDSVLSSKASSAIDSSSLGPSQSQLAASRRTYSKKSNIVWITPDTSQTTCSLTTAPITNKTTTNVTKVTASLTTTSTTNKIQVQTSASPSLVVSNAKSISSTKPISSITMSKKDTNSTINTTTSSINSTASTVAVSNKPISSNISQTKPTTTTSTTTITTATTKAISLSPISNSAVTTLTSSLPITTSISKTVSGKAFTSTTSPVKTIVSTSTSKTVAMTTKSQTLSDSTVVNKSITQVSAIKPLTTTNTATKTVVSTPIASIDSKSSASKPITPLTTSSKTVSSVTLSSKSLTPATATKTAITTTTTMNKAIPPAVTSSKISISKNVSKTVVSTTSGKTLTTATITTPSKPIATTNIGKNLSNTTTSTTTTKPITSTIATSKAITATTASKDMASNANKESISIPAGIKGENLESINTKPNISSVITNKTPMTTSKDITIQSSKGSTLTPVNKSIGATLSSAKISAKTVITDKSIVSNIPVPLKTPTNVKASSITSITEIKDTTSAVNIVKTDIPSAVTQSISTTASTTTTTTTTTTASTKAKLSNLQKNELSVTAKTNDAISEIKSDSPVVTTGKSSVNTGTPKTTCSSLNTTTTVSNVSSQPISSIQKISTEPQSADTNDLVGKSIDAKTKSKSKTTQPSDSELNTMKLVDSNVELQPKNLNDAKLIVAEKSVVNELVAKDTKKPENSKLAQKSDNEVTPKPNPNKNNEKEVSEVSPILAHKSSTISTKTNENDAVIVSSDDKKSASGSKRKHSKAASSNVDLKKDITKTTANQSNESVSTNIADNASDESSNTSEPQIKNLTESSEKLPKIVQRRTSRNKKDNTNTNDSQTINSDKTINTVEKTPVIPPSSTARVTRASSIKLAEAKPLLPQQLESKELEENQDSLKKLETTSVDTKIAEKVVESAEPINVTALDVKEKDNSTPVRMSARTAKKRVQFEISEETKISNNNEKNLNNDETSLVTEELSKPEEIKNVEKVSSNNENASKNDKPIKAIEQNVTPVISTRRSLRSSSSLPIEKKETILPIEKKEDILIPEKKEDIIEKNKSDDKVVKIVETSEKTPSRVSTRKRKESLKLSVEFESKQPKIMKKKEEISIQYVNENDKNSSSIKLKKEAVLKTPVMDRKNQKEKKPKNISKSFKEQTRHSIAVSDPTSHKDNKSFIQTFAEKNDFGEKEESLRRRTISSLSDLRSPTECYDYHTNECSFYVRHQSASLTSFTPKQGGGNYLCQKCGYHTTRINNLVLHHKDQCSYIKNAAIQHWQSELRKRTKPSEPESSSKTNAKKLKTNADSSNDENPDSSFPSPTDIVFDIDEDSETDLTKNDSISKSNNDQNPTISDLDAILMGSDDEDLLAIDNLNNTPKREFGFAEDDIVWVESRNTHWPALVSKVYLKEKKASIRFIDGPWPKKSIKTNVSSMSLFDNAEINKRYLRDGKKGSHGDLLVKAVQKAEDFLRKRCLGNEISAAKFFDQTDSDLSEQYADEDDKLMNTDDRVNSNANNDKDSNTASSDKNIVSSGSLAATASDSDDDRLSENNETVALFKERRRLSNAKLLQNIKDGKVETHLVGVYRESIFSERHQKFKSGSELEKNQLKHVPWFGPIDDEEQQEEIYDYCSQLFKSNFKTDGIFDTVAYIFEVWVPEAIVKAISRVRRIELKDAELIFAKGVILSKSEKEELTKEIKKEAEKQLITNSSSE